MTYERRLHVDPLSLHFKSGGICGMCAGVWRKRIRRFMFVFILYGIGILEAYYIPSLYGIEWMLVAIGATAVLGGFWMRKNWDW